MSDSTNSSHTKREQKIWKKILAEKEEVKHNFSLSKQYRYFGLIAGVLLGLILTSVWNQTMGILFTLFIIFYYGFYLKASNIYAFTNQRVLIHKGWLNTKVTSVDYQKITDVKVQEPFLSKIFYKAGHLIINTAGSSKDEIILPNIPAPYKTLQKLDKLRKDGS